MSEQEDAQETGQKHRHPGSENLRPPWKPGECPNPGGRPKGSSILAPLLRKLAAQQNEHGEGKLAEAHAEELIRLALGKAGADPKLVASQLKAALAILERADGAVVKEVHQQTEELIITLQDRPEAKRPE